MKITDVKLTAVKQSLEKPFWNSIKTTRSKTRARLAIYTDEGLVGMTLCSSGVRKNLSTLKDKLVGEDPLRIGYLWDKLFMGGTRKPVAKGDSLV